jgi:ferric-dicitrate binding protein FerR (iron transport regulator)
LPYFGPAMSRNQRILLVVVALAVAVIAFVIASPGSDDEDGDQAAQTTATQEQNQAETETETEAETEAETQTEPEPPPEPAVTRVRIRGGQVVGGAKTVEVTRGEAVRLVVAADAADEIHVHGYDITKNAGPGAPARFVFRADLEGVFEVESHVAEDAGRDPLVARLVVNPS